MAPSKSFFVLPGQATLEEQHDVLGIEFDGLAEFRYRPVQILASDPDHGQTTMGRGVLRLEPKRFAEVLDGPVKILASGQRKTTLVIRLSVLRIGHDDHVEIFDGLLKIAGRHDARPRLMRADTSLGWSSMTFV